MNPGDLKDHYAPSVRVRAYRGRVINAVYLAMAEVQVTSFTDSPSGHFLNYLPFNWD